MIVATIGLQAGYGRRSFIHNYPRMMYQMPYPHIYNKRAYIIHVVAIARLICMTNGRKSILMTSFFQLRNGLALYMLIKTIPVNGLPSYSGLEAPSTSFTSFDPGYLDPLSFTFFSFFGGGG
jgi:hypothetical protein